MHAYRINDDAIINLDMMITIAWGKPPLHPEKKKSQLQIRLNAPGELGPITYYLEGKEAFQLWNHVLEMIP